MPRSSSSSGCCAGDPPDTIDGFADPDSRGALRPDLRLVLGGLETEERFIDGPGCRVPWLLLAAGAGPMFSVACRVEHRAPHRPSPTPSRAGILRNRGPRRLPTGWPHRPERTGRPTH